MSRADASADTIEAMTPRMSRADASADAIETKTAARKRNKNKQGREPIAPLSLYVLGM